MKKIEVGAGLAFRGEGGAGEGPGGGGGGGELRTFVGVGQQAGEVAGEGGGVAGGNDPAGFAGPHGFVSAPDGEGDGGQTGGLGFDQEIREGLAGRGEDGEIGGGVERREIGGETVETNAVGEAEAAGKGFAGGTFGAVADEPELPGARGVAGKSGGDFEGGALVFLGAEGADAKEDKGVGAGAVAEAKGFTIGGRIGGGGGKDEAVGDDVKTAGWNTVGGGDGAGGGVTVGDDGGSCAEETAVEQRDGFAGAESGDDGRGGQGGAEDVAMAIGHAAEAEDDVGGGGAGGAAEAGGKPVEVGVERLKNPDGKFAGGGREGAAGTEEEQAGVVAGFAERSGEQEGLALGAAAAQAILHEEDFHCGRRRAGESGG